MKRSSVNMKRMMLFLVAFCLFFGVGAQVITGQTKVSSLSLEQIRKAVYGSDISVLRRGKNTTGGVAKTPEQVMDSLFYVNPLLMPSAYEKFIVRRFPAILLSPAMSVTSNAVQQAMDSIYALKPQTTPEGYLTYFVEQRPDILDRATQFKRLDQRFANPAYPAPTVDVIRWRRKTLLRIIRERCSTDFLEKDTVYLNRLGIRYTPASLQKMPIKNVRIKVSR